MLLPLTDLTLPHLVPLPGRDLDCQCHKSWSFCVQGVNLKSDCFVDSGGIVDNQCLFVLFINKQAYKNEIICIDV